MGEMFNRSYKEFPHERAARKLAEAQHQKGVTVRVNPRSFRVEYVRPDGTLVPGYDHFLKLAREGKI